MQSRASGEAWLVGEANCKWDFPTHTHTHTHTHTPKVPLIPHIVTFALLSLKSDDVGF